MRRLARKIDELLRMVAYASLKQQHPVNKWDRLLMTAICAVLIGGALVAIFKAWSVMPMSHAAGFTVAGLVGAAGWARVLWWSWRL